MPSNDNTSRLRPLVIAGPAGPLTAFHRAPVSGVPAKGNILVVPPFAEEMNRCRSMVAMQAQALAAMGFGTLTLDLRGTGDSAGEFDEGDWEGWRADLQCGVDWLRQQGQGCSALWGIRLGALMAAEMAADDPAIDRLLLWMPVVAGKAYWTQFLRIRIAAEMADPNGVKSTEELRQRSKQGMVVEASGYPVGAALAQRLDTLAMPDGGRLAGKQVAWLEVNGDAQAPMPRANAKLIEDWRGKGVAVVAEQVVGPAFWQVHERAEAPDLITASSAAVAGWAVTDAVTSGSATDHSKAVSEVDPSACSEVPISFMCGDAELAGVLHRGTKDARLGVVIVVAGGPQYRVGAHRQFVSLARLMASNGYPVLRFDLRGMGDSSGEHLGYHQSRADIRAAVDELMRQEPGLKQVALFGECESASGILFYAEKDARVSQIALANPWVRTAEGQAEVILKHYYMDRLKSPEFWRGVVQGKLNIRASVGSFGTVLRDYWRGRQAKRVDASAAGLPDFDHLPLPAKTAEGMRRFKGPVLLLMSGRDYIAREFDEVTKSHEAWKGLLTDARVRRKDIADADHTFSKPEAKAEAQGALLDWLAKGRNALAG